MEKQLALIIVVVIVVFVLVYAIVALKGQSRDVRTFPPTVILGGSSEAIHHPFQSPGAPCTLTQCFDLPDKAGPVRRLDISPSRPIRHAALN